MYEFPIEKLVTCVMENDNDYTKELLIMLYDEY